MKDQIVQALQTLFEKHRIVFWYDSKRELRKEFHSIELEGVEKIELRNDEFAVKYRVLREQPSEKFLIFQEGPRPPDSENWLLDLFLGHGEFRADQASLWLIELGLGSEFSELVREHAEFFTSAKRREALKHLLASDRSREDRRELTPARFRRFLLGVCSGAEPRLDAVLESLLAEKAEERDERWKEITGCRLEDFLWDQVKRGYGYIIATPSLEDFLLRLFKGAYYQRLNSTGTPFANETPVLNNDAMVFFDRWKDSRQHEKVFEALSHRAAESVGAEKDLESRNFRELMELDAFRLIDQKIISDLVRGIAERTIPVGEVPAWVKRRRQCRWYGEFSDLYEGIWYGASFLACLEEAALTMESAAEGIKRYADHWYKIDQEYRRFWYFVRRSGRASLMAPLIERIERTYVNSFLMPLNDRWQTFVDGLRVWMSDAVPLQRGFFEYWVRPFLRKENKVCVIVSDALRYEIGEELQARIRQEDRFEATLKPMLSMLPSYTQLGMAALLPNKKLGFIDDDSGLVTVDGQSSQGTANRSKILAREVPRGVALKADEVMAMKTDDCRALIRDHDVIYLFHNRIDSVGDKRESEDRAFEAVEETLQELVKLIKKLAGANANNLLVTADHGFLYQNSTVEESDFLTQEPEGEAILFRDRRFVLGRGLRQQTGFRGFHSPALGLEGEVEVQIPKSIGRLRLKGTGSRFVHGGASLQEVVIPVVKINKKRQSDIGQVEVEMLRGAGTVITSGQLGIILYQAHPVSEKVQVRKLRIGVYSENGELLSESRDMVFDTTSENPRDREQAVRLILTRNADAFNGQEVVLRLDEPIPGTTQYREYKSLKYLLRRSFTSDFDF